MPSRPAPSYSFGYADAHEPQGAHLFQGLGREGHLLIPLLGIGRKLALGKFAGDLAAKLLLAVSSKSMNLFRLKSSLYKINKATTSIVHNYTYIYVNGQGPET